MRFNFLILSLLFLIHFINVFSQCEYIPWDEDDPADPDNNECQSLCPDIEKIAEGVQKRMPDIRDDCDSLLDQLCAQENAVNYPSEFVSQTDFVFEFVNQYTIPNFSGFIGRMSLESYVLKEWNPSQFESTNGSPKYSANQVEGWFLVELESRCDHKVQNVGWNWVLTCDSNHKVTYMKQTRQDSPELMVFQQGTGQCFNCILPKVMSGNPNAVEECKEQLDP